MLVSYMFRKVHMQISPHTHTHTFLLILGNHLSHATGVAPAMLLAAQDKHLTSRGLHPGCYPVYSKLAQRPAARSQQEPGPSAPGLQFPGLKVDAAITLKVSKFRSPHTRSLVAFCPSTRVRKPSLLRAQSPLPPWASTVPTPKPFRGKELWNHQGWPIQSQFFPLGWRSSPRTSISMSKAVKLFSHFTKLMLRKKQYSRGIRFTVRNGKHSAVVLRRGQPVPGVLLRAFTPAPR